MFLLSQSWNDEERRALAYKQFAINLTIHSFQLANHPKSADGKGVLEGIQKIVANWMQIEGWLNNLEGISAQFYTISIVPLVKECYRHFGFYIKDDLANKDGEKLCETVQHLSELFFHLDGIYKMAKNGRKNRAQVEDILQQIHDRIIDDLKYSKEMCHNFSYDLIKPIDAEISKFPKTRAGLNVAFKQTFYQLLIGEENVNDKTTEGWNNTLPFAYKLFLIGEQMKDLFDTSLGEKMHWAYQQFAADLTIYSHRLYLPTKSVRKDILKIAENLMQIHMLVAEVKTKTNAHPGIGGKGGDH
jgi:hypothetical protein